LAIKSIFVKEYGGKLCLASHEDTQIQSDIRSSNDQNEEKADNSKLPQKENLKPKTPEKPKEDVKNQPVSEPPKNQAPKELRNYRVFSYFRILNHNRHYVK